MVRFTFSVSSQRFLFRFFFLACVCGGEMGRSDLELCASMCCQICRSVWEKKKSEGQSGISDRKKKREIKIMIALTCSGEAAWSLRDPAQWRDSLVFCCCRRVSKTKSHTHVDAFAHARDAAKNFYPDDKHADVRMRKVSERLYFLIHSSSFFFFIIYFLFLNLSNASAPLHFFFIFFCVSIILHICLCDILIKINLSGCFPSQTSTTARDPNGKESKSVWKALLLCLRSSYLYIYLLIYLETLPSKHILAESLMCGL